MNAANIRSLFGIVGGGASGVLIALVIAHLATTLSVGVCVAIIALCVIGIYGCKAVEKDGRRKVEMLPWQQQVLDNYDRYLSAVRTKKANGPSE